MTKAVAISGLAAVVMLGTSAVAECEPGHYRRKAESGRETVVGIGVRWNKTCQSVGAPEVWLDSAPANGFVCVRTGMVRPRNLLFGGAAHCLQTPMEGVQIVYRSRSGFRGADAVGYTLKFPRGTRSLTVDIDVMPATGGAIRPPDSLSERQPSGRAPECAALVS